MSNIQWIERNGRKEYAIVPVEIFEHLVEGADDKADLEALRKFEKTDDGFRIPGEIVFRQIDGESPIKLWREHRGVTIQILADQAGISKSYLSQLENGKRTGTVKTMKAIAAALKVPIDVLTDFTLPDGDQTS